MKSTGARVISRIFATVIFLFSFQYLVIVNQPLLDHFSTPAGVLALVLPSVLCLFFAIVCRRPVLTWLFPTLAFGVAVFFACFGNDSATSVVNVLLAFYIGGGYIVCLASIAGNRSSGKDYSGGDNELNHMTGNESGGVDTTGLMP